MLSLHFQQPRVLIAHRSHLSPYLETAGLKEQLKLRPFLGAFCMHWMPSQKPQWIDGLSPLFSFIQSLVLSPQQLLKDPRTLLHRNLNISSMSTPVSVTKSQSNSGKKGFIVVHESRLQPIWGVHQGGRSSRELIKPQASQRKNNCRHTVQLTSSTLTQSRTGSQRRALPTMD